MKRKKHSAPHIPARQATLPVAPRIGLPPMARQFFQSYRTAHPDEDWRPTDLREVATRAGALDRISTLISLLLILSQVLYSIVDEIISLFEGFGLWRQGFRPALNGAQVSLQRLTSTIQTLIGRTDKTERQETQRQIATDYDVLLARVFRFANIPVRWNPGDPTDLPQPVMTKKQRADALTVALPFGNTCALAPEVDAADDSERLITRYAVYHYSTERGRAELRSNHVRTLRGARRLAARLHRDLPTETFLIYRIDHPSRPRVTLTPVDYVNSQKPIRSHHKKS